MRALLTIALLCIAAPLCAAERPHVLFIVADDLNCAIGPYGDPNAVTPNLDRLAARGVTFSRAYCQQAVCNPSRSSFLTGRYPETTGVDDLKKSFRDNLPDVVTLPQAFLEGGYFTQCIGKMFHNTGETQDRRSWSVDEYLHTGTHREDTLNGPKKTPVTESSGVPDTVYRDGRITEFATDAISRIKEKDQPVFLAVGYWRPHLPFVAPKKYWELYDPDTLTAPAPDSTTGAPGIASHPNKEIGSYFGKPGTRHLRHGYYASISFLDAQIGQLLDALDESDLTDETIIVFTSDHGMHIGERGLWGKTTNFELDARVPLIISDPGRSHTQGTTTDSLAELVDLIPTLTELTGVATPPGQEGLSLLPAMEEIGTVLRESAFTQHQHPFYGKPATHLGRSWRTDRWRYTEWENLATGEIDERELYDHDNDPLESSNVIADHPDIPATISR